LLKRRVVCEVDEAYLNVTWAELLKGTDLANDVFSRAVIPFSHAALAARPRPAVDERTLVLIGRLRGLWRHSQLTRRDDFDRACLLLAGDEGMTIERYAVAFFQGAQIFALRRLTFFNAKSTAVSEDEMWLSRILLALYSQDYTSARYLVALRIAPAGHRRLMFLAQGLAKGLCAQFSAGAEQDRGHSLRPLLDKGANHEEYSG